LTPGNDIEDRFASAVKLALKPRDAVNPSPPVSIGPVRQRRYRRRGQWHVALLYMALTVTVVIIVVAVLLK
jgi:hypothetical protein